MTLEIIFNTFEIKICETDVMKPFYAADDASMSKSIRVHINSRKHLVAGDMSVPPGGMEARLVQIFNDPFARVRILLSG